MANKPVVNAYIRGIKEDDGASCVFKTVNLIWGTPLTEQIAEEDVKYVVKWVFDLKGATLEIPKNCIVEFDGGRIKNGTIKWDNTRVMNLYAYDILQNINEEGERLTLGGND